MKLWHAACVEGGCAGSGGSPIRRDTHASLLAQSLRSSDIDTMRIACAAVSPDSDLSIPGNFEKLGPVARIRALANPDYSAPYIRSFAQDAAALNIMRQCPGPHRSASGMGRYAAFCDILLIPYFPPRSDVIRQRVSVLGTGRAFRSIYRIYAMLSPFAIYRSIGIPRP